MTKRCPNCEETKSLSEFYLRGGTREGHQSQCKECQHARHRKPENRRYYQKYNSTEAGRARTCRAVRDYLKTDAGIATRRRYRTSKKGKRARVAQDARIRGAGELSGADWEIIQDMYGMCAYCYGKDGQLTLDHIKPVDAGGISTIDNVVPACKSCNSSKGAKPLLRWMYERAA